MYQRKPLSEHKPRSNNARSYRALLGNGKAKALMSALGGKSIYVPKPGNLKDDHKLVQILGTDAALKFCSEYGGDPDLYIPTGKTRRQPLKRAKIKRLRAAGKPLETIAKEAGCTRKAVYEYMENWRKTRKNNPQIDWVIIVEESPCLTN